MLSQTTEYALRAMTCLAQQPDGLLTTQGIAATARVPGDYLAKVLNGLAQAGLVHSQRGRRGGFMLARPATEVTVLDVVNAVDPIRRISGCPLDKAANGHGLCEHTAGDGPQLCPLHQQLDDAMAVVERAFAACRLTDLIAIAPRDAQDCAFPNLAA